MAKGNRGGQRGTSRQSMLNQIFGFNPPQQQPQNVPQVTPPTPQQIMQGNVLPNGGTSFDKFETMTDDEKADVIINAINQQAVPVFLDDSDMQKLAYFTGLNSKPQVVDEATLNNMKGYDLWRSVRTTYNPKTDIGYTSKDIYNQVATSDFTMYSDSGGSAYGRAIYFDVHKGSYGSGQNYTIMHAKIASNAKIGDYYTVQSDCVREMRSGSKLGKALQSVESQSQVSVYALAKGYDILRNGTSGYHMFLNRRGMVISKKTF